LLTYISVKITSYDDDTPLPDITATIPFLNGMSQYNMFGGVILPIGGEPIRLPDGEPETHCTELAL
jgi:hypothetical protein